MSAYLIPTVSSPASVGPDEVLLIASGDLGQSANKVCWPAQAEAEKKIAEVFQAEGVFVRRAHPCRADVATTRRAYGSIFMNTVHAHALIPYEAMPPAIGTTVIGVLTGH